MNRFEPASTLRRWRGAPTRARWRAGNIALGAALLFAASAKGGDDTSITWLVAFDGRRPPAEQGWTPVGGLAGNALIADGALRITDDSGTDSGSFRATWEYDPSTEIIVEARVRVESVKAGPSGGTNFWPSLEGAPVGLVVSDGRHQEGLVLRPEKIASFVDRVAWLDARSAFRTYRLVIRGNNMSTAVDGEVKIRGEGAFWKPATSPEPFIQFGSNSPRWTGESYWSLVRLGVRKAAAVPPKPKLRITVGKPWDIPPSVVGTRTDSVREIREEVGEYRSAGRIVNPPTRPYLYNMGEGLLLMSVAQGPDANYEPYGVLKSTDAGRTWSPVPGMQLKTFAPQPMIRLAKGGMMGVSRWNFKYQNGVYIGMTHRYDAGADRFTFEENRIEVPEESGPQIKFDRDIFELSNGDLMVAVYCSARGTPSEFGGRHLSFLLRSADRGVTWTHFSTIADTGEPAVVRFSENEWMSVLRSGGWAPLIQKWSRDGGKTWGPPRMLEMGSVAPDLTYMSNGVLACSYGRPGSSLMFSTDRGETWGDHQVITDERGYNYTAIREVSPGRLLYVHDAPRLRALYVDVERLE